MRFFNKAAKEEPALITATHKSGVFQIEIHHGAVLAHLNKLIPNGDIQSKSNDALRDLFDKRPMLETLLAEIRTRPTTENNNGKTTFQLKKNGAEQLIQELKSVGLTSEYPPRRDFLAGTDPQEHAQSIHHMVKTALALELSNQLFAAMSDILRPRFSP